MKRKNITTSIGTINLNNIEICYESPDIFIGIESVSADIQDKINEAVEIAKAEHIQMMKSFVHRGGLNMEQCWSRYRFIIAHHRR